MAEARSHTGRALRDYEAALGVVPLTPVAREPAAGNPLQLALRERARRNILVHNAREHNLKNIDVATPARPVHRDHRRLRLGQVDARVRHRLRRRAAALPRVAERLRAPVRAAGLAARRRRDLRHSADGGDRAAHEPRRPQEHGRDADRDLPLPAAALREARHAVLPGLRRADRAAERGRDRGADPARLPRPAHRPARAARRQPQGLLHRPREVGARQGLHPPARRRRVPADREVAAARPLQRAHDRAAGRRRSSSRPTASARCARRSPARSSSARASCTCWRASTGWKRRRPGPAGIASSSTSRSRCSRPSARARRAAAASPSSTRASSRSTRSTAGATTCYGTGLKLSRLRRGADRRGDLVERMVGGRRRALPRVPRASASTRWRSPCASATGRSPT